MATTGDPLPSQIGSSSAQLKVTLSVIPDPGGVDRALVVACGEIDIASVDLLRAATLAVTTSAMHLRGRPVRLELDWGAVSFLDCSGIRLLGDLHAKALELGWSLRWIPPSAPGPARLLRFAAAKGWLSLPLAPRTPATPLTIPPAPRPRLRGRPVTVG